MRYCRRFLAGIPHLRVGDPRVPHPSATPCLRRAFDLHVLGTPPAFILSQDQTRNLEFASSISLPIVGKTEGREPLAVRKN